jgi:hypothetical protein
MSNNALTLLQQHLKPMTPSIRVNDMEQTYDIVEQVLHQLKAGEIKHEEFLAFLDKDHPRFCAYLNYLAGQEKAEADQALKLLATSTQTDTAILDDLTAWVRQEDIAMNAHFENFEGNHPFTLDFSIQAIDVTTYKLTVDIVTDTPSMMDILWERREFETTQPELMMMAIVRASNNLDEVFYTDEPFSPIKPITNPMARYHPERAKVTREYIKNGSITPASLTGEDNGKGQRAIVGEMSALLEAFPLKGRIHENSGNTSFLTRNELQLGYYHNQFVAKGKQIFDINQNLTTLFKQTDVHDVPVQQMKTPYPCFYLYFGRQDDMQFTEGWHVDGAYVMHMPEHKVLQMMVTCVPDNLERSWHWAQEPDPCYFMVIAGEQYDKTFGQAMDETYEKKVDDLQAEIDNPIADRMQTVPDGSGGMRQIMVTSNSHLRAAVEKKMIEAFHEVGHKALRLVVNSLCYLSSYPEQVERIWPELPKHVQAQVRDKSKGNKKKMESMLEKMGYRPLHFCGLKFVQEHAGIGGGSEESRRQHWRRGHWRNQPYGEGRQQYRLRWIQPMLVNRDPESKHQPLGGLYLTN